MNPLPLVGASLLAATLWAGRRSPGRALAPAWQEQWRALGDLGVHDKHRCQICGERFEMHATAHTSVDGRVVPAGRCPKASKEPAWPSSIKDEKRAGALFGKRLASFWHARKTEFKPQ